MNYAVKMQENFITEGKVNFDVLRNEYLKYIDASDKTVETYDVGIRQFIYFMQGMSIEQPTRDDILLFREYMLAQGSKVATINTYLISLRTFFSFLEYNGIYKNITENVKSLKDTELHKRSALTIEQCQEVLNQAQSLREKLLFYIVLSCGLRANEIVNIRLDDFVLEQGKCRLYVLGKGRDSKTDYVNVPIEVMNLLNEYVKEYKITDYLFVSTSSNNFGGKLTTRSIERIINKMYELAGIKNPSITLHSLRHTFGTIAITNGEDIRDVSKAMRHKSVVTTERYLHDLDMQNNSCSVSVFNSVLKGA